MCQPTYLGRWMESNVVQCVPPTDVQCYENFGEYFCFFIRHIEIDLSLSGWSAKPNCACQWAVVCTACLLLLEIKKHTCQLRHRKFGLVSSYVASKRMHLLFHCGMCILKNCISSDNFQWESVFSKRTYTFARPKKILANAVCSFWHLNTQECDQNKRIFLGTPNESNLFLIYYR